MPEAGLIHVQAENVIVQESRVLPLTAGHYVHISIRDQGCGIPRELLSQVFDPYFTTKQKGSGLGLATSYSIIKNHGGLITVDSELGVGTAFHIYLPATVQQEPELPDKAEKPIPGQGKVLLMDDDDSIRLLAGEMLTMMGYEIVTAQDGAEAIGLYRTAMKSDRPFHAVILDLTVPGGMGGKETIERLTRIDPKVKAIVSSGYSNDPIMADHEAYGFVGVVAKPYTAKQLTETLGRIMADSVQ
jgi:CheY-like chemotaxis protein